MTVGDLQGRVLSRLGDGPSGGFYTTAEALTWINAAQRIMALLTLCLETTAPMDIAANTPYFRMLSQFPDWLLPLRVRLAGGPKLKPSRLSDLAAFDAFWPSSTVAPPAYPTRYAHLGFDLMAIYQQPTIAVQLSITYARCPTPLVNPGDVPQVPVEYHHSLIDAAIPLCRAKEGGQEWKKVLPQWDRFMDACTKLAGYVKARNMEQGYDNIPAEIQRYDRSKLLKELVNAQ